jgi:ribosomal protein S18 acetylase RimI-like enzyme
VVDGQSLTIRWLRPGDLERVARACFADSDYEQVLERLQDELISQEARQGFSLVVEMAGSICAALRVEYHNRSAWVFNVAVRPDLRGQGIAGHVLRRAEEECLSAGYRRMALHVRRDNVTAIRAYEKAGWRFTAVDGMRGDQLRYERRFDGDS